MSGFHNFDRQPVIQISSQERDCHQGWQEIMRQLERHVLWNKAYTVAIECYPGVFLDTFAATLRTAFKSAAVLNVDTAYRDSTALRAQLEPILTTDPVFGLMQQLDISAYFDEARVVQLKEQITANGGLTFLIGTGTHHIVPSPDLLLHASVTRWELQQRQRAHRIGNLGFGNLEDPPSLLYKGAFFLEWRTADDIRHELFPNISYFLDLDDQDMPRMVEGEVLRSAIASAVRRPFRVTPFFDPGPWGGQWMKETFDLPREPSNYAWCFDCVPEENSVTLGFGSRRFQLPAIVLVHEQPEALLGTTVYQRFGAEFPIRFDLLDTVGGGNLSLQVHPLTSYIREHFGMTYTQDESYYILDCEEGSELYLGVREGIDREQMICDLHAAQAGDISFPADRYVNLWPTRKHDHFSIPAGTIHCSGSGNLVLEISATPYIFTFKLWDWGRVGMDGTPRPIHLQHGLANIQWDRDTGWVKRELLDQVQPLASGKGWREERTGLHSTEFLETRRTWFTDVVAQDTAGNVHVLNLVEGEAACVESPDGTFAPFEIHYAETFIVPASVGAYLIRPLGDVKKPLAIVKAYVRPSI
jgi:mannose-6-phosphate isomerase class I